MNYYTLNTDNEPQGPVSMRDLQAALASGSLTLESLVCPEGGEQWVPLSYFIHAQEPAGIVRSRIKPVYILSSITAAFLVVAIVAFSFTIVRKGSQGKPAVGLGTVNSDNPNPGSSKNAKSHSEANAPARTAVYSIDDFRRIITSHSWTWEGPRITDTEDIHLHADGSLKQRHLRGNMWYHKGGESYAIKDLHTVELHISRNASLITFNSDYTIYQGIDANNNSPIYGHWEGASAPPGYPPDTKTPKTSQTAVATVQDQSGTSTPKVQSSPGSDQEGDQRSLSKFRRGPTINGFQLGMTLQEFKANLDGIDPHVEAHESVDWQGTQEIGDAIYDPLLKADKHLHTVDFIPQQGGAALAEVKVVGSPAIVLSVTFTSQLMTKMFNLGGMTFEDFCQNMVDNYDIPRLKGGADNIYSYNDPIHPQLSLSTPKMYYISSDGWTIVFKNGFWTDLSITQPAPAIDRGFGK